MFYLLLFIFLTTLIARTLTDYYGWKLPHWVMMLLMVGLWVSWFGLNDVDPFDYAPATQTRWLGLILVLIGSLLFLSGVIGLVTVRFGKKALATHAVFSKLRHPMYYGMILWMAGYPIFVGSITGHLFSLLGIIAILIWRGVEEKKLIAKHDTYREYIDTTWF